MAIEAQRGNPEPELGRSLTLSGAPETGRAGEPRERERPPKAAGESDHPIVLRDGRADSLGKGVTVVRSPQRPLAPDTVGPGNDEPTFLRAIANKAGHRKAHRFENLYGCLNESLLRYAWRTLNKQGAPGVDQVTIAQYGEKLDENIGRLVERLRGNAYRSRLIRRKYIPKGGGKERPLGIPVVEDRLLQAAARMLLEAIYEEDFLPNSYGYRPGVGAGTAVKDLTYELQFGRHGYVVEADIQGFFDHIDHDWLLRMLALRVNDRPFLGLIATWLKAGILDRDGTIVHPETGTPQGGVISPILANIYLHYALDLWFDRRVKPHTDGQAYLIRFADDFVCAFQYRGEAQRFYRVLPKRLNKFGLRIAPEKTHIHRFSRFSPTRTRRFAFLGFEFYWEADSKGTARVWRRTSRKKLRGSLQACKEWLRACRHLPLGLLLQTMKRKAQGHFNYFRAIGNASSLWIFYRGIVELLYKWLNRRSQRKSLTWERLKRVLETFRFPTPAEAMAGLRNRGVA